MELPDYKALDAMKNIDIRTVDKSTLVDLNSVQIDDTRPIPERIYSFLEQIGNPYCFRIGDVAVKVNYRSEGPTFQQNFVDLLRSS